MNKQNVDAGIITLHRISNYGSLLQVFALQTKLQELGYSVLVIDYVPKRLRLLSLATNTDKKQPLKTLAICAKFVIHLRSSYRLAKFINANLAITAKRYHSNDELKNFLPNAKTFITGSDQVWNSSHNGCIEEAYFLDFVPEDLKRISYAASFGSETIDRSETIKIREFLSHFDRISVREKSALKILHKAGLENISQNLDPVFLLKKEKWISYLKSNKGKKKGKKYVVIYEVNNENIAPLMEAAKKIASLKDVEIHFIKTTQKSKLLGDCDKVHRKLSPFEFIEIINNAEYVLSGSFHGAAFSIILNKTFFIVYPKHFSTRLKNILELFNLTNRVVDNTSDFLQLSATIDYTQINQLIDEENLKSVDYLRNALTL